MQNSILNISKYILILVGTILLNKLSASAQEITNSYESRLSGTISFKLIEDLKLNLTPEFRFDEEFKLDESLLEAKLIYKPFKYVSFSSAYRFMANARAIKETEYLHRIAFATNIKKTFNRFTTALKLTYSNYADDVVLDKEFLRYKLSLVYNIRKSKLTPFVGIEAFQEISDFSLYKLRYSTGVDYKILKNNYMRVSYKLDYYMNDYKNKHILCVGYKYKF